ncbi:prolyl oligopeptidase [Candidatus Koribacter versatilis Ellin345]|uniref:prolyl oligopeptidase n=1 Tax=Koribacter versatilis (strain Ellin345) TaxID=204669 RepID=Q1IJ08_KORVE|nr:prolyl oligopeptidase family serine peptidase [Candidatus Koribacter versatilis]ABF43142.1 prolyl oligopeptidase [Candidatus Koribacter versatilis Ellin345]
MTIRCLLVLFLFSMTLQAAQPGVVEGGNGITLPPPPPTAQKPVTETIHGVTITDPYRWLEDQQSPETRAWIDTQMKYTEQYLSQVKVRPEIEKELGRLERVEQYTIPTERGDMYFFKKRLADENQGSIYLRRGLHGDDQRLVDATKLSADQNTSIQINDISKDGNLLVYGTRSGGADEEAVHILDTATAKELPDSLPSARYFGIQLSPDAQGLYYSRMEKEGSSVYYHKLGSDPKSDDLIFGKKFEGEEFGPMQLISEHITENERYLVVTVAHGVPPKRVDIYAKDLRKPDSQVVKVIHGIESRFTPVNFGDDFYVMTDYNAPNYRVVKVRIGDSDPQHWTTVVPEAKDPINSISIVGGKLFVSGLHDVVTQTRIFTLDGKETGRINYPTIGEATNVFGREDSEHGFYSFESFIIPPTIYHYDVKTGKPEVFAKPNVPFDSAQYEVKQVFYKSKDGTRIPMFISSKKGAKRDGKTPTLMFAYGGFLVDMTPSWNPEWAWWIEQGGFYAQPNLRGGGEYGETWHKAGMFEKKQNVFDDFFGAAQYLVDEKYTDTKHLAIRGRSNGGLLMGVAMTQHPEMFGAIWCGYPLLDMLRFQNFLVGKWWTSEYGSAENADQFPYLLKYSPYHNVKPGTKFPAIMFNTGDSDTRVAPLHARKMTALVQRDNANDRPILLHYQTVSGHSAGVSITQAIKDTADELAFLWNEVSGK